VITHLYPYTLLVLYIYLVTLFHPIYNLLLGFSISLHIEIKRLAPIEPQELLNGCIAKETKISNYNENMELSLIYKKNMELSARR